MPLRHVVAEAVLHAHVLAEATRAGIERGKHVIAGQEVALVEPHCSHTLCPPGGKRRPHRAGAGTQSSRCAAALDVGQPRGRRKPFPIAAVAHHRYGMATAAILPRHAHAAVAGHRQRRPTLLIGGRTRLHRVRGLHAERIRLQRQPGDDDAAESPRLFGPRRVERVSAHGQRHLRRLGLGQLQRRAAGQHARMHGASFFPCRHKAAIAQRQHYRLEAVGPAQPDFRLKCGRSCRLHRQIALRAAVAVVLPHHAHGIARHRDALAIGRFDVRVDRCALNRIDGERCAPLPRGLSRPRQHDQQQRGRPHDLLPRNSSRVFCL